MSTKKLLFLTVLFLGLFAFVYFFERHQPTSAEVAKARRNLVDFDAAEVTGLALERAELPTLAVTKNAAKKWMLSGDKAGPGDNGSIESLVNDLKRLEVLGEVRTEFDPKEYGLDVPRVKATLTFQDGRKLVVAFGKELPGTDATAAAEANRFGAVKFAPIAALTKPVDEYRSRFLVDVPASEITRMTVVKGTTKVVVSREPGKDAPGPWKLEVPVVDAAKQQFVEGLLSDFTGSRISEFPTVPAAEMPRIGLSPANAVVTLEKGTEVVAQVAFGSSKADATGKIFAKSGNVIVLVEDRIQEALNKELSAFREVKLLPIDAWTAVRVSFESEGQRTGAEKLEGVWRSAGVEVPAAGPDDLVERLTRAESKAFVPRKEYPAFGVVLTKGKHLPPPVATMEVTKEQETAPRVISFYGAKGTDGTPLLLAEVSGRTDGLLVERVLLDDLKTLAEKLRRSASAAPTAPARVAPGAPANAAVPPRGTEPSPAAPAPGTAPPSKK